jgi:hypothetical protein
MSTGLAVQWSKPIELSMWLLAAKWSMQFPLALLE